MRSSLVIIMLVALSPLFLPQQARADRVDQVNDRFEKQSGRIAGGKGKHKMTSKQQVRADDAEYRMENQEQRMRTKHNGHLTKADQRKLNRELNHNSNRIKHDKGE